MRIALCLGGCLLLVACTRFDPTGFLADPPPWWDLAYAQRVRIQLDNAGRDDALEDFPVLVELDHAAVAPGSADGADIRFVDDDGVTVLDHEIERWDPAGRSVIWVRVPRVEPGADFIYMYFDNPAAAEGQNPTRVWSADYLGVYHLSDSLVDGVIHDSSGSARHGMAKPGLHHPEHQVPGWIGGGIAFDGTSNSFIKVLEASPFDVGIDQARTMSAWFRASALGGTILYQEWDCRGWLIDILHDGTLHATHGTTKTTNPCDQDKYHHIAVLDAGLDDGQWHHVVLVLDRGNGTGALYLDGGQRMALSAIDNTRPGEGDLYLYIGSNWDDSLRFNGIIDEVRIAAGARSPAWISAEYDSMRGNLAIVATSAEQRP
jgi:biopolymer transport protein ExbB